ncbi:MAG: (P)ppGpp synthetase I, SpoT/RelA [Parcubacteria group bacterium GW2011_GWC2_39_14]|nr:MAG: (P)ppGpp synthetase I, SpoT/RelA [Parcubacteria group bacterium GW2011_GWC2_39_14]KKR54710.1 MAG: (P)ppGpp synthetase I, SpoT/RelA [Parcubacteria group bacterium GW2011_GWA2_40_23]
MISLRQLIDEIQKNDPQADTTLVETAYNFANEAHAGQKRASGEDYIQHCLLTAKTLAELRLPIPIIIAGLLHDVPEDTTKTLDEIRKIFGTDIAKMVEGITKLGKIKYRGMDRYIENLRKMFVAMAQDIRVILIKFADRLHNLKTLYALPEAKQKRIALETLEIYSPIANRLGIGELQAQLEDAAFKYAYPEEFINIEQVVKKNFPLKKKTLVNMIRKIKMRLEKDNIKFLDVYGRAKHYYSYYRKYLKYNCDPKQIYDLVAVRIIVENIADCYTVMGAVHSIWRPIRGRIKDYIAQPKPNGYQSLHTAVFGDEQEIVEIQIRTKAMNEQAEYGIAAHWNYKEGNKNARELAWVQDLANWLKNINDNDKFLEGAKIDVFQNRIFVFTPQGDVIDLPDGATPVDFAYHIHTDIGDKCSGARINNEIVSLDYRIRNGDVVQIITDKNRKGPNPDWLAFVKTRTAIQHIEAYKNKSWKKFLPIFSK